MDSGRRPMERTPLSPVLMPARMRPGARSWREAKALAVTLACRVVGMVTPIPRVILDVFSAQAVISTYTSRHMRWRSPNQTASKPRASIILHALDDPGHGLVAEDTDGEFHEL